MSWRTLYVRYLGCECPRALPEAILPCTFGATTLPRAFFFGHLALGEGFCHQSMRTATSQIIAPTIPMPQPIAADSARCCVPGAKPESR